MKHRWGQVARTEAQQRQGRSTHELGGKRVLTTAAAAATRRRQQANEVRVGPGCKNQSRAATAAGAGHTQTGEDERAAATVAAAAR